MSQDASSYPVPVPVMRSGASLFREWVRREAVQVVGAALFALLLMVGAFQAAWPLALDVGGHDARFLTGFHDVELFSGQTARWMMGHASIALPRPPLNRGMVLILRLMSGRPADQPDGRVTIAAYGRQLIGFDVQRDVSGVRLYRLLVPPSEHFAWSVQFDFTNSTFSPAHDPRELGTVVERVLFVPLAGGWVLPSWWLLVWGAGLGALGYVFARSAGFCMRWAWVVVAVIVLGVAVGIVVRPIEVLPFVHRVTGLLGLGCVGVWVARAIAPTRWGADRRLVVRGVDLPIYLAVAWWMGPLFQVFLTVDGARNVRPPVPTAWIGVCAGFLLLVGVGGWSVWRGRSLPWVQRTEFVARSARVLFALAAVAHLAYMLWFAFHRQGPDFWILFKGAREWVRGGSLYDINAILTDHFGHVFKVPPFYGMLFVPFVFDDGERILFFHRVLNTLLIGTMVLVWVRMWGMQLFSAAGAGVLVLLNFRPIADTIAFGQIDLVLLVIVVLALWALQGERDVLAGALVALGVLFKVYPVLLLAFFVTRRRWYALGGFALGMVMFNGLAIAVMGWEMHRVYVTQVLPNIGGSTAWVENQTIAGFLARLTDSPTEAAMYHNTLLTLVGLMCSGVAGLVACVLSVRSSAPRSTVYALQYSQFLLLMVMVVPAAWMHYETLLFVPFAVLLLHFQDREVGLARVLVLAVSFGLIAYGNQWSFYDGTVMGVLTITGISYKFYGMLMLAGLLVGALPVDGGQVRLYVRRLWFWGDAGQVMVPTVTPQPRG